MVTLSEQSKQRGLPSRKSSVPQDPGTLQGTQGQGSRERRLLIELLGRSYSEEAHERSSMGWASLPPARTSHCRACEFWFCRWRHRCPVAHWRNEESSSLLPPPSPPGPWEDEPAFLESALPWPLLKLSPPSICLSALVSWPDSPPPVSPTPRVLCPLHYWDSALLPLKLRRLPLQDKGENSVGPQSLFQWDPHIPICRAFPRRLASPRWKGPSLGRNAFGSDVTFTESLRFRLLP